jgi:hypothetical protein
MLFLKMIFIYYTLNRNTHPIVVQYAYSSLNIKDKTIM